MTALLTITDMVKTYPSGRGIVHAVDGVSFMVPAGKTVALVGESGCGKSTIALSLLRLLEPDSGTVVFDGVDLDQASSSQLNELRRDLGVVFQNPYGSLNPRMTIRDIVGEPVVDALSIRGRELNDRVEAALREVGLGPEHMKRYPHQFSGGQRQRIAIARVLMLEPKLIVLDEPTAALDVSVQAQVLNLLKELQARLGMTYLFISHDLATVRFIADEIMVMYLGRIVESGPIEFVFTAPRHPYTRALLDAIPSIDPGKRNELSALEGEIPSPLNRPPGCSFAPRCSQAIEECLLHAPQLRESGIGRVVACYKPS